MVRSWLRGAIDFEALQLRIHPAVSRINMLAVKMLATFVAFDLLPLDEADLLKVPYGERRAQLVAALAGARDRRSTSRRSPQMWPSPSTGSTSSRALGWTG